MRKPSAWSRREIVVLFVVALLGLAVGAVLGERGVGAESGAAAYYGSSYSSGDWLNICEEHVGWGDSVGGCEWSDYWCVKPGYLPGSWLELTANGTTLECEVGDTVQDGDVAAWESNYVVEVSWDTFLALGLDGHNSVAVGGVVAPVESAPPEAPGPPQGQFFPQTGYWVINGDGAPLLDFWNASGGVEGLGYPIGGMTLDADGVYRQLFENGLAESWPNGWGDHPGPWTRLGGLGQRYAGGH